MKSKQNKNTRMIELVETHNIALSLSRMRAQSHDWNGKKWKRALYHAIGLSDCASSLELENIRKSIGLP